MKKILIILLLITSLNVFSEETTTVFGFQLENDGCFGSLFKTDEFYTNGFSMDCTTLLSDEDPLSQFIDNLDRGLRYDQKFHNEGVNNISSRSIRIAQNMYTPQDIEISTPIIDDRPYAGWTHFDFSVSNQYFISEDDGYNHIGESQYGISIGSLGDAGAGATQTVVHHKSDDAPIPEGWDNHVKNRIAVQLNLGRSKKIECLSKAFETLWLSTYWNRNLELGNVFLRGSQSITLKYGIIKEPDLLNYHDSSLLNLTREKLSDIEEKLDNIKDREDLKNERNKLEEDKKNIEKNIENIKGDIKDRGIPFTFNFFLTPKLFISAYNGTLDAQTGVDYNIEEVPVFVQIQWGMEITAFNEHLYLSIAPINFRSVEFLVDNDPPQNIKDFFYHSWGQVTLKCRY